VEGDDPRRLVSARPRPVHRQLRVRLLLLAHTQWTSLSGAVIGALGALAGYRYARPAQVLTEPPLPDAITVPQRVQSV
jgi:hypothetical protein